MDNYSRESKWHSQAEGGLRVVDHGAMKVEFKFRLYCGNKSTLRAHRSGTGPLESGTVVERRNVIEGHVMTSDRKSSGFGNGGKWDLFVFWRETSIVLQLALIT